MKHYLETVLDTETIKKRVKVLGKEISADYQGKEVVLVCVLRGSIYFCVDLSRNLEIPFVLDFIGISSYSQESDPLGIVRITKDLDTNISGKHALIVEDIVDTGLSLNYLLHNLKTRKPASLRICSFLNVPARRIVDVPLHYEGFEIPDIYAVGYGLDYREQYRNMEEVAALVKEK